MHYRKYVASVSPLMLLIASCGGYKANSGESASAGSGGTGAGTITSGSDGTVTSGSDGSTVTSGSDGSTVTSGSDGSTVTSGSDGTTTTGTTTTTTTGGAVTTTGSDGTTTTAGPTTGSGGATSTSGTSSTGGATSTGGTTSAGGASSTDGGTTTGSGGTGGQVAFVEGPCDIYADGGTPCVGAYSTVRRLSGTYDGPLYQVRRGGPSPNTGSGGTTLDIGFDESGFADTAAQDAFCGTETCTVSVLYDQSSMANHLTVAPGGCYDGGGGEALEDDYESSATRKALTVGGHDVYGLYMNPHEGYRNNQAMGTAEGDEPQGVYLLADGTHSGDVCCWDFGTAARDVCYGDTGIMSALMLGWGFWGTGAGSGPWMMADFELGVWSGGSFPSFGLDDQPAPDPAITYNPDNPPLAIPYAFGILTTGSDSYTLRMGNAASGDLTTAWDGDGPTTFNLKGAIILGVGGDNSNWSWGTFYEGAITAGRPTSDVDEAVFRNVQAAKYGQ